MNPLVLQSSRWVVRGFPSPLLGVNPDDTYNETPYEKGFSFVSYLAHLVGDQGKFDAFLQVGGGTARGARPKTGVGRHEMLRGEEGLSAAADGEGVFGDMLEDPGVGSERVWQPTPAVPTGLRGAVQVPEHHRG